MNHKMWDLKTPSFCQAQKVFTFTKGKATFSSMLLKFSAEKPNSITKSSFKDLTQQDTIKLVLHRLGECIWVLFFTLLKFNTIYISTPSIFTIIKKFYTIINFTAQGM